MPFITPGSIPPGNSPNLPYTSDNPETPPQSVPVALVTQGDVTLDDNEGQYVTDPDGAGWTDYEIRSHYEEDRHIYMGGVSSPQPFQGASASFVQLTAHTLLWIVQWTAARLTLPPKAPNPESVDPRWILMDRHIELPNMILGPDGVTPLWRISGVYVYGCTNPNEEALNDMAWPRPPWVKDVFTRDLQPSVVLMNGLITLSQATANTSPTFFNPIQRLGGNP